MADGFIMSASRPTRAQTAKFTAFKNRTAPFVCRRPNTGFRVQGFSAEEIPDGDVETFVTVTCAMCKGVHLVNPATGPGCGN